MNSPQYLSWENFASTVFLHGQQRVHRIASAPNIEIFGDGFTNRVGIWIEVPPGTEIPHDLSGLAIIKLRTFAHNGGAVLEATTSAPSLHRQFYHFAVAVAERVIVEKISAVDAIALELRCFTDLLEEKASLGIERQLGLLGELIFLEYLITKWDATALDSWLGPLGEPHDFRVEDREFEVKTTVSTHRIHTIHGAEQLVPSKSCSLYLVSVLLGPPGADNGFSLAEKVAQVSTLLAPIPPRLIQFIDALTACGFRHEDSGAYSRRFAMRRPIGLIPIDDSFPAITRLTIQTALGPLAPRVESLQYDVSVEGLEHEDGSPEFTAAVLG
jgi:hypothetical protein